MADRFRRDDVHGKTLSGDHVMESPRRLAIRNDIDVLVCGGGPAGSAAAIAAAREGARVMLIERHGMLGGVWTAGLMNPFFECMGRGWIVKEIIERLKKRNAFREWFFAHTYDTEVMKFILEEMMEEAGVTLLYHTFITDAIVENGRLRGVVIESKAGREAVTAKVVIDATGDGDVAARAGCRYELGRAADGLLQPMTLMFEIRGIGGWEMRDSRLLYDAMAEIISREKIDWEMPFERAKYVPWIINTPSPGTAAVQLSHVYRLNSLNPSDITRGTIDCRKQIHKAIEVLKHVPGLEKMELVRSGTHIGVREGRRVRGMHWLTLPELEVGATFDDGIAACGFVVDIHEPNMKKGAKQGAIHKTKPYEIPYRCLVAEDVRSLLLAGRCISGSFEAHASYRQTGTCSAMGQAAGLAAAWAVRDGIDVRDVPGEKIKRILSERGAEFVHAGSKLSTPEDD